MLTKTISALTNLAYLICISHQLQNLCTTNRDITHVADPSLCNLYIICDRYSNGDIRAINQGSCYGSGADYVYTDANNKVWCTVNDNHCNEPLWFCPPAGEHDIMVADPYDRNCRRHRQCRNLSGNFSECTSPLVFNRNTGLCDYSSNAPCTRVALPVGCPVGGNGFYPGKTCYEYIYCQDGSILFNLSCSAGMYFDETARSCLYGSCPRAGSASEDDVQIDLKN